MLSPSLCPESLGNLRTRRDGATRRMRRVHTRRNAPSWEILDAYACGVCGMYLFGCSSEAPNHICRTLVSTRPDACAPRKHRCDLPQVATLRHRGSGVASSGHVLQAQVYIERCVACLSSTSDPCPCRTWPEQATTLPRCRSVATCGRSHLSLRGAQASGRVLTGVRRA